MAYLLLPFPILSYNNYEITDSRVPENLNLEVQAERNNTKTFIIQATADNVIKYDFRMAGTDEAIEKNTTGTFEFTITSDGKHKIEVRTYDEIGVFHKEIKEIDISGEEEPIISEDSYSMPLIYKGYELKWNDEFDGNTVNFENGTFKISTF